MGYFSGWVFLWWDTSLAGNLVTLVLVTAFFSADVLEVTGENNETGKQYGVAPAVRNSIIMLVVLLIIAIVVVIMVLKKPFSFPTGKIMSDNLVNFSSWRWPPWSRDIFYET